MVDSAFEGICALFITVFIIIFLYFALIIPITFLGIAIEPNVEVFVCKELVYKGTNACVRVESSGDTTTVRTSKWLCMMPDKTYTSKDVFIRTVE